MRPHHDGNKWTYQGFRCRGQESCSATEMRGILVDVSCIIPSNTLIDLSYLQCEQKVDDTVHLHICRQSIQTSERSHTRTISC